MSSYSAIWPTFNIESTLPKKGCLLSVNNNNNILIPHNITDKFGRQNILFGELMPCCRSLLKPAFAGFLPPREKGRVPDPLTSLWLSTDHPRCRAVSHHQTEGSPWPPVLQTTPFFAKVWSTALSYRKSSLKQYDFNLFSGKNCDKFIYFF